MATEAFVSSCIRETVTESSLSRMFSLKAAQFSARKLLEVNVPCFGAVLNGLNLAVSGYYYAQYYDKSYKDYYVTMAKQDPGTKEK